MDALQKAIDVCGSTYALAEKVGVGQSVVSMWKSRKQVPAERCIEVEKATDGKVTRYDLRPDVFGKPEKRAAA